MITLLLAGANASALLSACPEHAVELLGSHAFQVDLPADSGLRLPRRPTTVRVWVGPDGVAREGSIYISSGDSASALGMATRARYRPASKNCRYVASAYLYVEDWQRGAH